MADACDIDKGQLHRLLNGNCPACGVGLMGHFGPKFPQGVEWWRFSCPVCAFDFAEIPGAPHDEWGLDKINCFTT